MRLTSFRKRQSPHYWTKIRSICDLRLSPKDMGSWSPSGSLPAPDCWKSWHRACPEQFPRSACSHCDRLTTWLQSPKRLIFDARIAWDLQLTVIVGPGCSEWRCSIFLPRLAGGDLRSSSPWYGPVIYSWNDYLRLDHAPLQPTPKDQTLWLVGFLVWTVQK